MATSDVEIVNSALIKLGVEPILTMNDASTRARVMKSQYDTRRKALLESHPWNFAISFVELAAIDPLPDGFEMEYDYVFQLPANCLRVIGTDLASDDEWEEVEGNRIACNISELKVKFIKDISDVTKFKGRFAETLAYDLASTCAMMLTGSETKVAEAKKDYERYLAQSRSFDAQVGSIKMVESNDWLDARKY